MRFPGRKRLLVRRRFSTHRRHSQKLVEWPFVELSAIASGQTTPCATPTVRRDFQVGLLALSEGLRLLRSG